MLPWLSAYLGHRNLLGTEHYLQATPELLAIASRRLQRWNAENAPYFIHNIMGPASDTHDAWVLALVARIGAILVGLQNALEAAEQRRQFVMAARLSEGEDHVGVGLTV